MPLEITITNESNNGKRVSLAGSLDTDTAPKLQTRIDESIDSSVTTLILDMKDLEFLSSAGLGVIFMTKKVIGSHKGNVILLNLQPQVLKGIRNHQGTGWHEYLQRPGRDGCLSGRYAAKGTGWRVVNIHFQI